jgi:hypothetical protein
MNQYTINCPTKDHQSWLRTKMVELRGKLKQPTAFDTVSQMITVVENGHTLPPTETLVISNIKKEATKIIETMEKENALGTRDTVFSFDAGKFHYTVDLTISKIYYPTHDPGWKYADMSSDHI